MTEQWRDGCVTGCARCQAHGHVKGVVVTIGVFKASPEAVVLAVCGADFLLTFCFVGVGADFIHIVPVFSRAFAWRLPRE
eukprot:1584445-Prymnesium_polylepis.2